MKNMAGQVATVMGGGRSIGTASRSLEKFLAAHDWMLSDIKKVENGQGSNQPQSPKLQMPLPFVGLGLGVRR
jgi:hypothetical protein